IEIHAVDRRDDGGRSRPLSWSVGRRPTRGHPAFRALDDLADMTMTEWSRGSLWVSTGGGPVEKLINEVS
ncbi:hypothetical protein, partial [Kineococcus endophyticus]